MVAMCDIHALGEHGLPRSHEYLAYAMSKAALAEMVRSLARELAPRVRVNAVAPGVAAWPESGRESDKAAQQAYLSKVPLARAGTPEECAEVVRWLALEATYLTGEIIRFDGGRNML
jgi:pteridine reductase